MSLNLVFQVVYIIIILARTCTKSFLMALYAQVPFHLNTSDAFIRSMGVFMDREGGL